ncbi:RNA-binding protein 28-like [Styela clava]
MKSIDNKDDLSRATLFVRGIPPSCSNDTLSEVFSVAGPIKECFVVKYKSSSEENKRPCIGYVTYMTPDDAKSALRKEDFKIDDSTLKISLAKKKKFSKKKDKKLEGDTFEIVKSDSHNSEMDTVERQEEPEKMPPKQDSKNGNSLNSKDTFTVIVTGFPALYKTEHVINLWKKCGLKEPREVIFPSENIEDSESTEKSEPDTEAKDLRQSAKFIVDTKQAALKAYNKLSDKNIGKKKNYKLKVNFLTPEGNQKAARKSRLIVRNVSFKCTEGDLKKTFSSYGTVTEVKIPTKPDGKKRGFAFVQFSHVFEAARAIKALNMQEIKGRKVAIDWSLPKEKYKEMNSANSEPLGERTTASVEGDKQEKDSESESGPEQTSDDSGLEEDESEDTKETSDEEQSESDEETSNDELSESDKETSDEESEEEEENPYTKSLQKASKTKPTIKKKLDPKSSHDVHEGRTVFVLNLSYDTTEESLTEVLNEYGELIYTKIVLNYETGMSKGCGFAQYKKLEDADKCVEALGGERTGKFLDGREIRVVKALSRGDTDKMRKEGKKKIEKEDKRNLYLGREGMVRSGTQAAEGLSQIELKKREKIENAKRSKLKNPNIFVSKTRLCFHNLPKSVEEAKLRQIILKQFEDKRYVRIIECRIMRDLKNVNEKGIGKPLGYAFINFIKHENALKALRSLNNNPEIFGPIKRPIVEFALENKKALEIKENRKKKYQAKMKLKETLQQNKSGDNLRETVPEKKLGRRKRQNLKRQAENAKNFDGINQKNEPKSGKPDGQGPKRAKLDFKNGQNSSKNKKFGSESKKVDNDKKMNTGNPDSAPKQNFERKSFQGSSGTTLSGKKLPMPSHAGPKMRQKNRGKILEQMRRSKKLNTREAQQKLVKKFERQRTGEKPAEKFQKSKRPEFKVEKPSRRSNKRNNSQRGEIEFNNLVAKYTKAFMNKKPRTAKPDTKWYET